MGLAGSVAVSDGKQRLLFGIRTVRDDSGLKDERTYRLTTVIIRYAAAQNDNGGAQGSNGDIDEISWQRR